MAFTPDGDLFFADEDNNKIRCYVITGGSIIVTVAGTGQPGFSGDGGLAPNAQLNGPTALAIDTTTGSAFIADSDNNRIRQLRAAPPVFQVQSDQFTNNRLIFKGNSRASAPASQTLRLVSNVPNVLFNATVTTESGGSWLSVSPSNGALTRTVDVTANPQNLDPGTYRGVVTLSAPLAVPPAISIQVEFQVGPVLPVKIVAQPAALTFSFTQGGAAASQALTLTNAGSGSAALTITVTTNNGGNWLTVTPASATVLASTTGIPINVRVDPTGLRAGTYLGQITLTGTGISVTLPVTVAVNPVPQRLLLSPVGLTFIAVQNGGLVPSQTFTILNPGSGTVNWRARITDISGGTPWLSLGPEGGSTAGDSSGSTVEVRANPAGLGPGEYYAQIEITSSEAVNSPQSVTVFLGVLPPGTDPGPVIQPTGLVFRNSQKGSPGSQEIRVTNLGGRPLTFRSARAFVGAREWFVHLPGDATVAPDQPARIVVQPQIDGLATGIYQGSLTLIFADNSTRTVSLLLINTPPGGVAAQGARAADGCIPQKLLPIMTSVGLQSTVLAGWPNPLVAEVVDDCGNPLTDGSVVSEFSNSDPPVLLTSSKDGKWSGIWQIRSSDASQVTVRIKAARPETKIEGTSEVTAAMRQSGDVPPVVAQGGILSAASFLPRPPGPGSFISIFGARLADQFAVSSKIPFENELAGTTVSIAGRRMPLYFTTDGQINAIIPYGVAPNTTHQLVVKRGSRIATPEPVTVSQAWPAIFTQDQSGRARVQFSMYKDVW